MIILRISILTYLYIHFELNEHFNGDKLSSNKVNIIFD